MSPARLLSLDAFRGLTIAGMVLVNNPGTWTAIYPPLRHAAWHGLTPTDVVFPFFLFIVGVAIPPALGRRRDAGGVARTLGRVLRRAAVIFFLGLVLNGLFRPDWATLRIPGVLQRIAVCYLIAAVLFLTTSRATQAIVAAALLGAYWAAMTLVPVPGYGAGDLRPEANLAAWVDRAVLGTHIWRASRVYDPEGVLSTLPAIATVLLGVLTGGWLWSARPARVIAAGLLGAGTAGVALGAVWGVAFPVNKALWTSSYAVLTAGLALLVLAACYWTIEIRGWRRWAAPFAVLGVNALALFFLSTLVAVLLTVVRVGADGRTLQALLFAQVFAPWAAPVNASLAYAVTYLAIWWLAMWGLDRAGIHLRA